mmetsp:Transcript_66994/g.111304  ORF Transcript_66994/g.111304 Transcript_66994/m.111304 type:complete len:171 (+) Transcript_66994:45-557(+)|eukprot:CAMPEP_0119330982 /NCGR_PEP_ID=MMETSP1333-20130426/79456_1 /TAXON_ID=418940 /ORGANISM="Scyphosphaera apsteinii, Strain RCC1455" /LENGTH=170 /DNA_ID=CAMNT_0007340471 /DNA_START=38 /DNA_END=550 /DNA_ORIENTATION=+
MDSLLYVGAADDDEDEDEEDEDEEGVDDGTCTSVAGTSSTGASSSTAAVDFEALQRAGYSGKMADLSKTGTYMRLEEEAAAVRQQRTEAAEAEAAAAEERRQALDAEKRILDRKGIDERIGYEKRFDRTGEGFRAKEKRKRAMGQQNRDGNWVEEEKRRLRHDITGNYDS